MSFDYDLIVIGSGPAGQRAAVQAAKAGARVVVIERRQVVGGVCLHAGTIPSKTLREAVLYFRGVRQRHFYGKTYIRKRDVSLADLTFRVNKVLTTEMEVLEAQLKRNKIDMIHGQAGFVDAHTLHILNPVERSAKQITGDYVILATGTIPRRPADVPFDYETIFDSDFIFSPVNKRNDVPKSIIILGAGVIGTEYAAMLGNLGVETHLVDPKDKIMPFIDRDILKQMQKHMEDAGVTFHLGLTGPKVIRTESGRARVEFDNHKPIEAETLLFAMGRAPFVEPLNLPALGIEQDDRGHVKVDSTYRTNVPSVFAVGDLIGFPALASVSSEQGRMAASEALGIYNESRPSLFPFGIYTIPEISMVGKTEQQLESAGVPYAQGVAFYREIAKANMIGDEQGALKLLFHRENRKILGVHIIGDQASELIHIGQAVLSFNGTLDYFIDTVFNYPTLAEAYKVAALSGRNALKGLATYSHL